ncbi:MAG TPA: ferredoxin-thioredoxin reductase catalytic domain-containing protein [Methanothrix sp.]|nr:ferredoxin-thioredoxin reductase catalytic domain-containing protein [Methanothrix sp.]HPT19627.1 ferredoxin-thioredoxin reductase catalytic domain-containing protein [Methanothrix sp.]
MTEDYEPGASEVDGQYFRLEKDAKAGGYNLNSDRDFVSGLVKGLLVNEKRYGYRACPCRLASGVKEEDIDLICPCDYRDEDITEFGACYCALYVSKAVLSGKKELSSIPERRPVQEERERLKKAKQQKASAQGEALGADIAKAAFKLSLPVWRCTVCGYLCARNAPPEICPICKVGKERFERFI